MKGFNFLKPSREMQPQQEILNDAIREHQNAIASQYVRDALLKVSNKGIFTRVEFDTKAQDILHRLNELNETKIDSASLFRYMQEMHIFQSIGTPDHKKPSERIEHFAILDTTETKH